MLETVLAEIEAHVHAAGWDRPPALFALVRAGRVVADDPATAAELGLDGVPADVLTPVEQDELPDDPLDEVLAGIGWPESVDGCALSQEILVLPPSAQADLPAEADLPAQADLARVSTHPERREARLVVAVLRDGTAATLLRLRAAEEGDTLDDVLTGPDLAPNLAAALRATFDD